MSALNFVGEQVRTTRISRFGQVMKEVFIYPIQRREFIGHKHISLREFFRDMREFERAENGFYHAESLSQQAAAFYAKWGATDPQSEMNSRRYSMHLWINRLSIPAQLGIMGAMVAWAMGGFSFSTPFKPGSLASEAARISTYSFILTGIPAVIANQYIDENKANKYNRMNEIWGSVQLYAKA